MKNYEINEDTLAIISNYPNTKIYEGNKSYLIKDNTLNIIKKSCEYFGSTFEGRRRGTRILTGYSTKSPIIIEESKDIIFFPTSSPRSKNCSWISLNNVKDYRKIDKNTEIVMKIQSVKPEGGYNDFLSVHVDDVVGHEYIWKYQLEKIEDIAENNGQKSERYYYKIVEETI